MDFAQINSTYTMQYLPILLFIVISVILTLVIIGASFLVSPKKPYFNKLRPYESGFNNFQTANRQINVRFYVVAILFLIFDIEIIFMYPWAVAFTKLSNAGFYAMMIFFVLLVIGFIYEIKKGALTWN